MENTITDIQNVINTLHEIEALVRKNDAKIVQLLARLELVEDKISSKSHMDEIEARNKKIEDFAIRTELAGWCSSWYGESS
jgi:hypothetical protein